MYTYKIEFDNGKKYSKKCKNLDALHNMVVTYMDYFGILNCSILCQNGVTCRVRKTGAWHHKHMGYEFD